MRVQLFIPCFVDQLYPQTALATIKILEKAGCEVIYPKNQTCCGQPAYNAGCWDEARSVAKKFTGDFNLADYIVAPGGSCTGFIRKHYGKLFPELKETELSAKVYELTDFLTGVLKIDSIGSVFNGIATYHDACGALRECGVKAAPRQLLSKVAGLTLIETDDCEVCCGFGGTFSVKFSAISSGMSEQKLMNAMATGAEYIISTDASCLLQLDGYIKKQQLPLRTIHIAEVLASGW